MSSINSEEIISILKEEIDNFQSTEGVKEVGNVIWVGDGIATVYGIDHAMYGEIVTFENGVKGMVQDIKRNEIGVIIFGKDTGIKEGTKVARTKKRAGIPVGENFIGRIVDALGAPIDGKGEIEADDYRPIEQEAPGIIDRKSVSVPMETGILAIDSMFPIGRGQRELIIGDRQTGKTSIAIDTILNQKGKDVMCIYVAIGQKASTVAKLVGTLEKYGAMEYTTVFSATASDCAPLQYIVPYSGTALAEYFMYKGKDVLIVDVYKRQVHSRLLNSKTKICIHRHIFFIKILSSNFSQYKQMCMLFLRHTFFCQFKDIMIICTCQPFVRTYYNITDFFIFRQNLSTLIKISVFNLRCMS